MVCDFKPFRARLAWADLGGVKVSMSMDRFMHVPENAFKPMPTNLVFS